MKNRLAAKVLISAAAIFVMVFALGYNLSAQARNADTGRMDLNTALISLDRASQATQNDIANMHVESWKSLEAGIYKRQFTPGGSAAGRNVIAAQPALRAAGAGPQRAELARQHVRHVQAV